MVARTRGAQGQSHATSHAGRWFPDPLPALIRARHTAERIARESGMALADWDSKNGRVVLCCPEHAADDYSGPLCSVCGGERLPA